MNPKESVNTELEEEPEEFYDFEPEPSKASPINTSKINEDFMSPDNEEIEDDEDRYGEDYEEEEFEDDANLQSRNSQLYPIEEKNLEST